MLTRRAAPEVFSRDEDRCIAIGGLVQHELGDFFARIVVAQFEEQALAEPGTFDRLQELLGDDHIGVDVAHG